jgi:hypothetical protein
MPQWLADVGVGALSSGVNPASLVLLNLAAIGAAVGFGAAVATLPPDRAAALGPHAAVAAGLALALAAAVDWVLWHVGVAAPSDQRAQVQAWLGGQRSEGGGAAAAACGGGGGGPSVRSPEEPREGRGRRGGGGGPRRGDRPGPPRWAHEE